MNYIDMIKDAADYINSIIDAKDAVGLVLGSGLGNLADEIDDPIIIPYKDIPHFPLTTVPGHAGEFHFGYINGVKVLCMKGRFHFYEGHSMQTIALPIRVMKMLGIKALILTNAAGGCNLTYKPGTLMLIKDFINYMGTNPLIGENLDEFGPRFPDMTKAMDEHLMNCAKQAAESINLDLKVGVYMAYTGPNYETPAEIKMSQILGADAVGMSTVPEILVARQQGTPVMAISCITNMAAGITGEELTHEEVQEVADRVNAKFRSLIKETIKRI